MARFIFSILIFLSGIACASPDGDEKEELEKARLALLNQHLTSAMVLSSLRKEVLDSLDEKKAKHLIDNYIDVLLMNDLSVITMKSSFKDEYASSETARNLYIKDIGKIMPEFCRHEPLTIYAYGGLIAALKDDCKGMNCNCDVGSN